MESSKENLARLTGAKMCEIDLFFDEQEKYDFCEKNVTHNGTYQICNRRMRREYKERENNRLRQKKYREKKRSNENVTLHSPSPSPSPSSPGNISRVFLPPWLDQNLWSEFKKYRTKIKCPLTEHAEKLCLTELRKLMDAGDKQEDIINQTIVTGKWKSFYPVKNKKNVSLTDLTQKNIAVLKDWERKKNEE